MSDAAALDRGPTSATAGLSNRNDTGCYGDNHRGDGLQMVGRGGSCFWGFYGYPRFYRR